MFKYLIDYFFPKTKKIYKISQNVNYNNNVYEGAIVYADSSEDALNIHPSGKIVEWGLISECMLLNTWVINKKHVLVEYIGESNVTGVSGIILSSFRKYSINYRDDLSICSRELSNDQETLNNQETISNHEHEIVSNHEHITELNDQETNDIELNNDEILSNHITKLNNNEILHFEILSDHEHCNDTVINTDIETEFNFS